MKNKMLWTIKGKKEKISDEKLIMLIKQGKLKGDDLIKNNDLKKFIPLSDTIYEFYLRSANENL